MDAAPPQSISSLEGEREAQEVDNDYRQPGADFLSEDDSEASDDSRPGHGRQDFPGCTACLRIMRRIWLTEVACVVLR